MQAAKAAGRNPIDDLALTFAFQGSPGTGVTAFTSESPLSAAECG